MVTLPQRYRLFTATAETGHRPKTRSKVTDTTHTTSSTLGGVLLTVGKFPHILVITVNYCIMKKTMLDVTTRIYCHQCLFGMMALQMADDDERRHQHFKFCCHTRFHFSHKIGAACQRTTKSQNKTIDYEPLTAFGFNCFLREEAI